MYKIEEICIVIIMQAKRSITLIHKSHQLINRSHDCIMNDIQYFMIL